MLHDDNKSIEAQLGYIGILRTNNFNNIKAKTLYIENVRILQFKYVKSMGKNIYFLFRTQ